MGTCYKCLHFDLYQIFFFLFIMTLRIYGIQKATGSRAPHVTAVVQTQATKKKKRKITRNELENLPSSFTDINDVFFF